MPQRPDEHIIADIALNRVVHFWNQCGWACEVVHKDYGDDLLIQTSHKGIVDHNRIWVQVKGTRNIEKFHSKKYGYSLKVPVDHALKWIRSADLVVVVLWDIEKDWGLWSIPKQCINQWEWYSTENKDSRLLFDKEAVFDKEQAVKIGWKARVNHFNSLINNAITRDIEYEQNKEFHPKSYKHESHVPLVAFDFLKLINVLDDEFVDKTYLRYYRNALKNIKKEKHESDEDIKGQAAALAILGRLDNVVKGCGVPATMIEICTQVILNFIDELDNTSIKALKKKRP